MCSFQSFLYKFGVSPRESAAATFLTPSDRYGNSVSLQSIQIQITYVAGRR